MDKATKSEAEIRVALKLVNELAGSIKVPARLRGRDVDEVIREAKREHFRKKGSMLK